jgi:serine/threonine protein kinase
MVEPLTSEKWERAKEIFEAALGQPPEHRSVFVEEACQGDSQLKAEVENLLAGDARADPTFLNTPTMPGLFTGWPIAQPIFRDHQVISRRFEILRFIGRGGMGEVYEAKDLDLDERVALKAIRSELSSDPVMLKRFRHELQLARRVTHPNVCRLHHLESFTLPLGDSGDTGAAVAFITMELLEGETLAEHLSRQGRMTESEALPLVCQIADGLAAAHEAGVIHRDLKPGNIILVDTSGRTRAVVTDFGLARAAEGMRPLPEGDSTGSLSGTGRLIGTPQYMAPEQVQSGKITPATDIYALGLIMYEMLTGRRPFVDHLPLAGAFEEVKQSPLSPRVHFTDLDPTWESVILRCLEVEPSLRLRSSREIVRLLNDGIQAGSHNEITVTDSRGDVSPLAQPSGVTEWPVRRVRSARRVSVLNRRIFAWTSLSVMLLGVILFWWRLRPSPPPIVTVTTSSVEARERYLQAVKKYEGRNLTDARDLAESALDFDSKFPMAHLLLARIYDTFGNRTLAANHLSSAKEQVEKVTDREKHAILGFDYCVQRLFGKAREQYQLVLNVYPDDLDGLRGLADADFWLGKVDESVAAKRKAIQADPHSSLEYYSLMQTLVRLNRFDEVLSAYDEARANDAMNPQLHWLAAIAYWGKGRNDEVWRQFEFLAKEGNEYEQNLALLNRSRFLIYLGRMREAEESLQTGLILDQQQKGETWITLRMDLLTRVKLLQGLRADARASLRQLAGTVRGGKVPEQMQEIGHLAIASGDLTLAHDMIAGLNSLRASQNGPYEQYYFYILKGELALASGAPDEAIADERDAEVFAVREDCYSLTAESFFRKRDWHAAASSYRKLLDSAGVIFRDGYPDEWVMAHLALGRTWANRGDQARALRYYDEFLQLWTAADADLPALREARREQQLLKRSRFPTD